MGTALEYGDVDTASGGLSNSEADSVNLAGVTSAADLNFTRGSIKNEATDSTLIINDGTATSNTALFDNYNTYFDFRRIEYLTVDDAANMGGQSPEVGGMGNPPTGDRRGTSRRCGESRPRQEEERTRRRRERRYHNTHMKVMKIF